MKYFFLLCFIIVSSLALGQEIFPSISGTNANAKKTGDLFHQYDFWLKPDANASSATLALFDAGLGGIADLVSGSADTKTIFELIPFDALYKYENGTVTLLPATVKPAATLATLSEVQYINRWYSFTRLNPEKNGWILRVRTIGGNDVNTFQLMVTDTNTTQRQRNDWSILAIDLSIAMIRVTRNYEAQIRPFNTPPASLRVLNVYGKEDTEIGIRDIFGNYTPLPVKDEFFIPSMEGIPNSFGVVLSGSLQKINNLVIKGSTSPVLWELKPTVIRKPEKPTITALQQPGSECYSVTLLLNESTKRNLQQASPLWIFNKKTYGGDSSEINFGKPGHYVVTLLVPTNGIYFPKFWTEKISVQVNAPPVAVITTDKTVASPGEIITLSAIRSSDREKGRLKFRWFVNGEYRSDEPTLQLSSVLPTEYSVKLVVNDGALQSSCTEDTAMTTVRINAQPYAEIDGPTIFGRDEPVTFAVKNVVDNDNDTLTFLWSGTGISGNLRSRSVTVHHRNAGTYNLSVMVNDNTNTTNASYTTTVTYRVNAAPVPVFHLNRQMAPGDTIVLDARRSTDADNSSLHYTWSTSNGISAEGEQAKIVFQEPGDYTVTLTADDGEGVSNSVNSITQKIHINAPPLPVITANARSTAARQRMSAEQTTDNDNTTLKYFWNFGDGSSDSGKIVTHTYQQSGRYNIVLTVNDLQHQSNSIQSTTHELVINRYPTAKFTIPKIWEPHRPLVVDGSASTDADGEISAYTWFINGKEVASGARAELKFEEPGDYAVALRVKDNSGFDDAVGLKTMLLHVNYPPTPKWKMIPAVAEPNVPVTFDASASTDKETRTLKKITWKFSDGVTATGIKVTRTFSKPGKYNVTAIVDDESGCSNSVQSSESSILVNSPPIIVTTTTIRSNSRRILLDASSSYDVDQQAINFEWLLPNRTKVHQASFYWDAPGGGVYFVTLTANDGQGKKNSITRETIKILVNRPPVAVVDSLMYSCTGQTILFNGSLSYDPDGDAISTRWDFGDGTTSTETNPAHSYTKPGFYSVTLLLDDGVAEQPTTATIPIIVEGSPIAVQNITDTTVCVNVPVEFDGTKSSDPNGLLGSYTWDFGDGITSFGSKVSHAYTKPGTYFVTLTVIGAGTGKCSRVSQATSTIRVIEGPSADFTMKERASIGEVVTVDPAISKPNGTITSIEWKIGQETTMTAVSLEKKEFQFKKSGTYPVTLTMRIASASNCNTAVITKKIQVNEPPVIVWNIPSDIALGDLLILDGSASHDSDGIISQYEWKVDKKIIGTTPIVSLSTLTAGVHSVSLKVTDNSGTSSQSVTKETMVRVNSRPHPSFTLPNVLYENEVVVLKPKQTTDADGDTLQFSWKLDDVLLTHDSVQLPAGRHIITLTANDGRRLKNSVDSVQKEIFVIAAPQFTSNYPQQWIVGTTLNANVLFNSEMINFIIDGNVQSTWTPHTTGVHSVRIAWTPKQLPLQQQTVSITVWDSLKFIALPHDTTIEWNPSNPTTVLTAPPLNRNENVNITYEWWKGSTLIGVGKIVEVHLNRGENIFTLRVKDQHIEGAHWTEVKMKVKCE